MINEKIKAAGIVSLVLTDKNGQVIDTNTHNLVVNSGLAYIISRMKDSVSNAMSHIGVGTGTTAASASQTSLVGELARAGLTSTTIVTTNVSNDSIQYVATFDPGIATGAITEAGIFNDSTSGSMLARTVFPVINKGDLDTLTITWKITIA